MCSVPPNIDQRREQRRLLWVVLGANIVLMAAEVASAAAFHSLALVADAVHRLTDVSGLAIAILALGLADRPPTPRLSFGFQRAEVLAALANGIVLLGASAWVVFEAVRRLIHPVHVPGAGLLVVASIGLSVSVRGALR